MRWLTGLVMVCLLPWARADQVAGGLPEVRLGVLAKRGDAITLAQWNPTADYLGWRIPGVRFRVVPLGFERLEGAVLAKEVDFILANTHLYAHLELTRGVYRIATLRNRGAERECCRFGGVIFSRRDHAQVHDLKDLRGRRFAAVDPDSLGGYLAAARELRGSGLDPALDLDIRFLGTHDAVVREVMSGRADAGTVRTDNLEAMAREGGLELGAVRVLHPQRVEGFPFLLSTRLYPEWPMAALPHVDFELVGKVASALLTLPANHPAAVAAGIGGWSVSPSYQPVHELLRELGMPPYAAPSLTWRQMLARYWGILLAWGLLFAALISLAVLHRRLRQAHVRLAEALERQRDDAARLRREQEGAALARERMVRSEKLASIGQLAAGVAHEINNPLAYVNANLATLSDYVARLIRVADDDAGHSPRHRDSAEARQPTAAMTRDKSQLETLGRELPQLIAETRDGVERIRLIAANLKDFARTGQSAREPVRLDDVVERTLTIVWNALKYKAEVRQEFNAPPAVMGVSTEISQVLMNLLTNAVQAIDQRGVITVRTGHAGGEAWVEVEDTGRGMTPEVRARIFEPFFTTKPAGEGTGLGLAISQAIVERHQGRLEVESHPGRGSRFRLVLPLAGDDRSAEPAPPPEVSFVHA